MTPKISDVNKMINAMADFLLKDGNQDRVGIYKELGDTIQAQRKAWNELYAVYLDDTKRTKFTTAELNKLKKEIEKTASDAREIVKHGPAKNNLTADDRLIFGIPEESPHSKIPKPIRQLILAVVEQTRRMFKLQASFVSLPGFNDGTVISKYVKGINVLIAIKDIGDDTPPTEADFTRKEYFTKATFELFFEEADIQKTAYMKAALVNPTGEVGPYGEAIKFVIPS